MTTKRLTIADIRHQKGRTPLVCLTAYTAPIARLLDPHCDILLVGDSLGMVIYGYESTLPVTIDMMALHGQCVVRHSQHACIVIDMPFGSYQTSPEQAFANAAYLLSETGCQAVKLEGGVTMADTIYFLTKRGIPVIGHVGLEPQSVNIYGSYRARGINSDEKKMIMKDALSVQEAGAGAIVLENIPQTLAHDITQKLNIPTIGIGACAQCDGQIVVSDDMFGLSPFQPRFVKTYAHTADIIQQAALEYAQDVKSRSFPDITHCTIK